MDSMALTVTIQYNHRWTQRGKAATEWKMTESWLGRIMFDGLCGSAFCGLASNNTILVPHDSVLP
jgi:hypothetical protein